jgi:hypothetical protein
MQMLAFSIMSFGMFDPPCVAIYRAKGRYIICLAAKYRIRRMAILTSSDCSSDKDGRQGRGIEACQRSSCRCNSSQTAVIDMIPSRVVSSGAMRDVEDKKSELRLRGYNELWTLFSSRRIDISARKDVEYNMLILSHLGRFA